jgi:FAD binding domain
MGMSMLLCANHRGPFIVVISGLYAITLNGRRAVFQVVSNRAELWLAVVLWSQIRLRTTEGRGHLAGFSLLRGKATLTEIMYYVTAADVPHGACPIATTQVTALAIDKDPVLRIPSHLYSSSLLINAPSSMAIHINGLKALPLLPGTDEYIKWQQQYAFSTYGTEHDMNPGLIVVAENKEDIKALVEHAAKEKKAIAIRSGGHQYCGASSTGRANILLDVSTTFRNPEDLKYHVEGTQSFVYASVSYSLLEFNTYLGTQNVSLE